MEQGALSVPLRLFPEGQSQGVIERRLVRFKEDETLEKDSG
ncbi:MAG: hypothetical protein A4E70_00508 [Syntrophus sp. PtaU1.Bin005]|nr:MAG: hypothetical protein A4E69_00103 [Syntrophus sp. PtaB.Bin138]OPY83038.1 MAG: hypothetical protein A4E70_00508 [Syntrophus sp. PtaU1.Bin005]